MSNQIPKGLQVNIEKVNGFWVVEILWADYYADSVWLARDKDRRKALLKANKKLKRAMNTIYRRMK